MELMDPGEPVERLDEDEPTQAEGEVHVERWAAAYHEAGHAVFAFHEYRLFRLTHVSASRRDPGAGLTVIGDGYDARGPYYEAWLALAGRAAERQAALRRYGVKLPPFVADEDFVVAHEALFPGALKVKRRTYLGARLAELEAEQLRVSRWMRLRWREIEAIARALLARGTLPGAEADALLRGFGLPSESEALRSYALRDPFRAVPSWWRREDDEEDLGARPVDGMADGGGTRGAGQADPLDDASPVRGHARGAGDARLSGAP